MTKKLFAVLVVAAVMLTSSLVIAADKKGPGIDATEYTPPAPLLVPDQRAVVDRTIPASRLDVEDAEVAAEIMEMLSDGTIQVPTYAKQDTCMVTMHTGATYYDAGWTWEGDIYKEYQDPETSDPPCASPVYPFEVTKVYMHFMESMTAATITGTFDIEIADLSDPSCPKPGPVIWTSPLLTYNLPNPGHWRLSYTPAAGICVNGPYFVSFTITADDATWGDLGPVYDASPDPCRSWTSWGTGWFDWVVDLGHGGNFMLYSEGLSYADAYNICPAVPECEYLWWHDGNPYWYYPVYFYLKTASWFASPRSGYIARARVALFDGYYYGTPDAWIMLWDGNPTTGPANRIDSIYVPNSDFVFHPAFIEVDFTPNNVTVDVGDYVFVGVVPINPVELVTDFAVFADANGNGIETHSWFDDGTGWIDEYTAYGDYAEFLFELEFCGEEPCHPDSDVVLADYGAATYIFAYPSTSGRDFFNQRFTLPFAHGGRLDMIRLAFYNEQGTPSPDVYVWLDDGAGYPLDASPPLNAMASYHIDNADVVTYPSWQMIDTWEDGLYFSPGEEFHVGYSMDITIVGDTLSHVTDNYNDPPHSDDRASWWFPPGQWETSFEHYGIYLNMIAEVTICQTPPPESTFALVVAPLTAYMSPGDTDFDLFDITVVPVAGYNLNVDLDIDPATLPAGFTYTYVPASGTPEFTADLLISADGSVVYGSYTLTLRGTGADAQQRTKDVTIIVQPPYDEGVVHFYHGLQRTSTFAAIGNAASSENFVWYGANPLYDGTIISAVPAPTYDEQGDHVALDVYDCVYTGIVPNQHLDITYEPWCQGSDYEEWYGEVAYSNWQTEESVISCEYDSFFVIGLKDVECTDFSIKIKIYYNPTQTDIPELWAGVFEDWDVGAADNNWGDMDTLHNMMWIYDVADPSLVFGIMKAPFYDEPMHSMVHIYNPVEVYTDIGDSSWVCGKDPGLKYLYKLMVEGGYRYPGYWSPDPDDRSTLIVGPPFSLNPVEKHIEIWIDFGRNLNDGFTWEQWYHKILRYVGFYRGDVDASDTLELPALDVSDLVYLINYLYKGGPAPQPFADQGDVDGSTYSGHDPPVADCPKNNVMSTDVVYLLNYIYKSGPPPVDYVRFIPQFWSRPSLFLNPNW